MSIDTIQPIALSTARDAATDQQRAAARYVVTKARTRAEAAEFLAMLGLDQQKPRRPRKVQRRDGWPSDLGARPKANRAPAGPGAVVEQAWTDKARCRYQPDGRHGRSPARSAGTTSPPPGRRRASAEPAPAPAPST
ncbi:hypothetical protein [Nocardia sp. NPDC057227]|uniref:hypothetical protein n=1 Tax=Nocardia sp. NPDC057227 TaxID=3346056 RepID=UPI00363E40FE